MPRRLASIQLCDGGLRAYFRRNLGGTLLRAVPAFLPPSCRLSGGSCSSADRFRQYARSEECQNYARFSSPHPTPHRDRSAGVQRPKPGGESLQNRAESAGRIGFSRPVDRADRGLRRFAVYRNSLVGYAEHIRCGRVLCPLSLVPCPLSFVGRPRPACRQYSARCGGDQS